MTTTEACSSYNKSECPPKSCAWSSAGVKRSRCAQQGTILETIRKEERHKRRIQTNRVGNETQTKTSGGLTSKDLVKSKTGGWVSKKKQEAGKHNLWAAAMVQARADLDETGFQPLKKGTALYTKTVAIHNSLKTPSLNTASEIRRANKETLQRELKAYKTGVVHPSGLKKDDLVRLVADLRYKAVCAMLMDDERLLKDVAKMSKSSLQGHLNDMVQENCEIGTESSTPKLRERVTAELKSVIKDHKEDKKELGSLKTIIKK